MRTSLVPRPSPTTSSKAVLRLGPASATPPSRRDAADCGASHGDRGVSNKEASARHADEAPRRTGIVEHRCDHRGCNPCSAADRQAPACLGTHSPGACYYSGLSTRRETIVWSSVVFHCASYRQHPPPLLCAQALAPDSCSFSFGRFATISRPMPEGQDSRSIRVLNPQAARGALRTRKGNSCAHLPAACSARLQPQHLPQVSRIGWAARASLHNFLSSTSKDASCAGRAERQGAMAWMVRTIPMSLLLAGIGYSQDAQAQTVAPSPLPTSHLRIGRDPRARRI